MSERLWGILVDSFGKILLPGLTVTIPLTAISFTLALIIAVAVALVQFAHVPVLQRLARFYIWVIRGTPVLVQLFVVFYGLPGVGILIEPFPAAVLVFSINEGAYCAETIRAALESVPKGQMEAGQCVGMSYLQIIRRIILPQAMRTAFPSLSNSLISMIKDTSLAANITVTEMLMTRVVVPASTEILYPLSEDMPRASAVRFCTVSDFAKVAMSFAMSWLAVRSLYAVVLEELASSFAVSTYTDTVAVYWFCMRPQLKPAVAIASTTGSTTTRARCLRSSLNSSSSVIRSSFSSASYVRCLLTCR